MLYYNILYDNERQIFQNEIAVGTERGVLRPPTTTPTPGQALTGAWRVRLSMTIFVYFRPNEPLTQMTIRLTGQ